jgi:hypothetical protein
LSSPYLLAWTQADSPADSFRIQNGAGLFKVSLLPGGFRHDGATVQHLLDMQSGVAWDYENGEQKLVARLARIYNLDEGGPRRGS